MATPKDRLSSDATRAATRSFPGYVADRVMGRADFAAPAPAPTSVAAGDAHVGDRARNPDAYKNGGLIKGFKHYARKVK